MPGQLFDHILQFSPKSYQFQRVVAPTGRDAKVRLVGGHVVNPVMLTRQNYVALLQPLDGCRELAVRVRPLVDLIGERDQETESQQEAVDGVPGSKLVWSLEVHQVGEEGQRRESDETVVAVRFDEVVTSDGERINVVLTERPNESLQAKRERGRVQSYSLSLSLSHFSIKCTTLKKFDTKFLVSFHKRDHGTSDVIGKIIT